MYRKIRKLKNPDAVSSIKEKRVKIKGLQPPMFSGEIRDYPNFKKDNKRLLESNFDMDPYALRSCLGWIALNSVKGVEYDLTDRLDEKFGNNCILVYAVICDLKSIKHVNEGDNKFACFFLRMVEKV